MRIWRRVSPREPRCCIFQTALWSFKRVRRVNITIAIIVFLNVIIDIIVFNVIMASPCSLIFPTSHLRRGSNWVIPDSSTLILSSLLFRYFQRIYSVLINWRNLVAIMFYNPIHHQKKWSSWGVPCYKLPFPSPIHHRTKLGNGNFQRCRSSGVERLDELPGLSAEKMMMMVTRGGRLMLGICVAWNIFYFGFAFRLLSH